MRIFAPNFLQKQAKLGTNFLQKQAKLAPNILQI